MKVVVVGAGWSGLAAAVTLTQQGHQVHLIEAAKQLGGRARNVTWNDIEVDNGQHLMIGAYHHMLSIMQTVGIDPALAFDRSSIDINVIDNEYPALKLSAKHALPWPFSLAWNLVSSIGCSGFFAVARLQRNIPTVLAKPDQVVADWLHQTKQPERLIKQLWEPLCLAALNTPITEASAHLLATVIHDSLGKGKKAADLLIPKQALGDLFPIAAASYLQQNGGQISLKTRVTSLMIENNNVQGVMVDQHVIAADSVIIATAATAAEKLVASKFPFPAFDHYPIITVYLQFSDSIKLNTPMLGLSGTTAQWVFDRSQQTAGLLAVVISGPGKQEKMNNQQLIDLIVNELTNANLISHPPIDSLVIREKRATFAATKNINQRRPATKTPLNGLWLAGDYVLNDYPATLEGAIINGIRCAESISAQS
jgi:squalene-associated FAD-dependent desaturase